MDGYTSVSSPSFEWEWRKRRRRRVVLAFITAATILALGLVGRGTRRRSLTQWKMPAAYAKDPDLFPQLTLSDLDIDRYLPKELFLDHIRVLSDDKDMAGRGVGTQGEEAAVTYIETVFNQMHPEGLVKRQEVPLIGSRTVLNETTISFDSGTHKWHSPQDWSATVIGGNDDAAFVSSEDVSVVFGGYCTPQFGKWTILPIENAVIICLVGEPDSLRLDNGLQTYYTRWVYKLEEMARQKARGVLLIHTEDSVGYPWQVIQSAAEVEQIRIAEPAKGARQLEFWGWLNGETWQKKKHPHAPGLEDLFAQANNPEFVPRQTDWYFNASILVNPRALTGQNVVVDFFPSNHSAETVLVLAHHDHLGIGSDNVTVYPGALDNASGVSKMMLIAKAMSQLVADGECCRRNVRFLSTTAEEAVLLGSQFYGESLHFPGEIIGAVNFDGANIWGETNDVIGIGADRSTLGELLHIAAAAEGQAMVLDQDKDQALFFRSDQFSLARVGIPAIKPTHGHSFRDKPKDFFENVVMAYNRERYHQPSDDYTYITSQPDPTRGALQELRVALRVVFGLANGTVTPQYIAGAHEDLIPAY